MSDDRQARFGEDGRRELRSVRRRLGRQARLEAELRSRGPASRRLIATAVRGELSLTALTDSERQIANAQLDITIRERAAATSFGRSLLQEGRSVVAADENGEVVRYEPDGSTRRVITP